MNTAFFVRRPRRIEQLQAPHPVSAELPYEIVFRQELRAIDYENLITDLLADRQFLEDAAPLCGTGNPMRCLLACQKGRSTGLLLVPRPDGHVEWAAYLPGKRL